jgi:hypothetical protein
MELAADDFLYVIVQDDDVTAGTAFDAQLCTVTNTGGTLSATHVATIANNLATSTQIVWADIA